MKLEEIFKPEIGGWIDDENQFDTNQASALKGILDNDDFVSEVLGIARTLKMNKDYESEKLSKKDIDKVQKAIIGDCNKLTRKLKNMPQSINYPLMVFEWKTLSQKHGIEDFNKLGAILNELSTYIQDRLDDQTNGAKGRNINSYEWIATEQLRDVFKEFGLEFNTNSWENSEPSNATTCLMMIFDYVGKPLARSSVESYIKDIIDGSAYTKKSLNNT